MGMGFAPTWHRQVSPPPCFIKPLNLTNVQTTSYNRSVNKYDDKPQRSISEGDVKRQLSKSRVTSCNDYLIGLF